MSKRLVVLGLAALCMVAFTAVSAAGAQAAGETAYTVVNGSHVAIPAGESTQLTVTGSGTQLLETETFGASVILTGTGVTCEGCHAENKLSGGVMDVTGTGGRLVYTGVTVNLPGCEVFDPVSGSKTVRTEPLKVTTTSASEAVIEPAGATPLALIHLKGGSCILPGTFEVNGFATGTLTGSTLSVETEEGELTFGPEEEPAYLTGKATVAAGPTGAEHHPVELTAS